jgi:orotidine 5'-phosphate decarboxylase subfamily 2
VCRAGPAYAGVIGTDGGSRPGILGTQGMAVLEQVIAAVPAGIPVILDAKRGDIASTAQAYAQAAFYTLGAGALTVSPYLGRDSVEPFLADGEHGVFLLCKTSNPGAADLQDLEVGPDGLRLYEQVARLALSWNRADTLGLVVGSTQPDALRRFAGRAASRAAPGRAGHADPGEPGRITRGRSAPGGARPARSDQF